MSKVVSKIICPICNEELFFSLKTVGEGKVTEDGKLSITLAVDIDDIEKHFEKHKDYETESVSGYLGKPPNVMSPSPLLNEKDLNGSSTTAISKTRKEARNKLEKICEGFEAAGIKAKEHVYVGDPDEEIEKAAKDKPTVSLIENIDFDDTDDDDDSSDKKNVKLN